MKLLDLTLDSPAENVAIDEALLETAELMDDHPEVLRIWEPSSTMVVLGRSSPLKKEVDLEYCRSANIDIVRRCSGGQTIVTGPGCLMYAVLLNYHQRPELRMLENTHRFVMGQMQKAVKRLDIQVEMLGTSDLTLDGRKFSGNSLRCKRNWLVYHGTMICQLDIDLIGACSGDPIREPEYRANRSHSEFLTQLPTTTDALSRAIVKQWNPDGIHQEWPVEMTRQLAEEKYASAAWTNQV